MMLRTAHKSFKPGHYPYSLDSHDLGGFFLEAGSNDAEDSSDSLHFELNHCWKVR